MRVQLPVEIRSSSRPSSASPLPPPAAPAATSLSAAVAQPSRSPRCVAVKAPTAERLTAAALCDERAWGSPLSALPSTSGRPSSTPRGQSVHSTARPSAYVNVRAFVAAVTWAARPQPRQSRVHATRASAPPPAADAVDADDGARTTVRTPPRADLGLDEDLRQLFRTMEPTAKPEPSRRNKPASDERKRKVSESCKGTNTYARSKRHRQRIAVTMLQRYGQMTPQQRMNRCRACGGLGHRAATCEVAKMRAARAAVWDALVSGNLVPAAAPGSASQKGGGASAAKRPAAATAPDKSSGGGAASATSAKSRQTTVRVSKPRARVGDKKLVALDSAAAASSAALPAGTQSSKQPHSVAQPADSRPLPSSAAESGGNKSVPRDAVAIAASDGEARAAPAAAVRVAGELCFGCGLAMPTLDDPFHVGPVQADTVFPLPTTPEMTVALAWTAAYRAWLDGERLQTMSLPITPQPRSRGPMPPSTTQQFKAVLKLAESVMSSLKRQKPLQGPLKGELLYEADETIGKWEGERMAAVIYPTADTLDLIRGIVDGGRRDRLVLCVNPQWVLAGQVVSDFGFGASSLRAEAFIKSFVDVFYVKRLNVRGDDVTILHVYPGGWQVHWMNAPGKEHPLLLEVEYKLPTYDRLVELLRAQPGSRTSMSWVDRVRSSLEPTLRGITGSFSASDDDATDDDRADLVSGSYDIIAGPPGSFGRHTDVPRALKQPPRPSPVAQSSPVARQAAPHRPVGTRGAVLDRAEPRASAADGLEAALEADEDEAGLARARARKLKAADDAEAAERQALLRKLQAIEAERERVMSELAAMAAPLKNDDA